MALGMDESYYEQDTADEVFLIRLEEWLMRAPTVAEEEMAFAMRDQGGYGPKDAAAEIMACAAEVAA